MENVAKILTDGLRELQIDVDLDEHKLNQLMKYSRLLLEWNEKINLTAIVEPNAVAIKHFVDSIALVKAANVPQGALVFDVGTGAGFPGIPLKIARPDIRLVLVDSLNKRCKFLQTLVDEVGLSDVEVVHARAEDLAGRKEYRESADLVASRAVARLNVLLELTLPFVKVGGSLVTLKGPEFDLEVEEAKRALSILGGKIEKHLDFSLPVFGDKRVIGVINKVAMTPKTYPRKAGTPERKPL